VSTTAFTDPVDGGSVHIWTSQPATTKQRARARLALMHAGRDTDERRLLLQVVDLDQADEIRAQLHRTTNDKDSI